MSDKKEAPKAEGEAKPAAEAGGGGLKGWLPLLVSVVLMPVLAFATTKFLILPKLVTHAREGAPAEEEAAADAHGKADKGHGAKADKGHGETKAPDDKKAKDAPGGGGKGKPGGKKQSVQLSKLIVNVSGSMGTRYLMSSLTLAGSHADLKTIVEENKDQLLDLANTTLASKTITELERPGSRNQLRSELMSVFNHALGGNLVQEIYFTEFAIQ